MLKYFYKIWQIVLGLHLVLVILHKGLVISSEQDI